MDQLSPPVERYLFDRGFDCVKPAVEVKDLPPPEPVFGLLDMETARAEGYARGLEAVTGAEEGRRAAERARQASLDALVGEVGAAAARVDALAQATGTDAVRIALAITRKLLPVRWKETAADEIEALVHRTMAEITDRPVVMIHVAPSLMDELAPRLSGPSAEGGAASGSGSGSGSGVDGGALRLHADPALEEGDCRLEWRGGGATREQRTLWADVEKMVEQAFGIGALTERAASPVTRMDGDE